MLRLPTLLIAFALLVCAGGFAFVADDQGSAAVGALGIAVVLLTSWAAEIGPWRRDRAGFAADASASERAIRRSRELIDDRMLQVPHASALAPLSIAGLARIRGQGTARTIGDPVSAFDAAEGRFVLVGEPGAGKSTVLVQLCHALLERGDVDPDTPIPVLLSLTTWRERRQQRRQWRSRSGSASDPFTTWFVEQSALTLGISERDARLLLPSLVPVLDGLDEVASDQRRTVAAAIEQIALRSPRRKLVVACREREFTAMSALRQDALPAYRLEPLSRGGLVRFFEALDAAHWKPVLAAIKDPRSPLGSALSTPLMLTVAIAAWGTNDPTSQIPSRDETVEQARGRLWDLWVERAARQAGSDAFALAVGLARAAEVSTRTEIRFEELGDTGTRRAWWSAKIAVAVTIAVATQAYLLAVMSLCLNVMVATPIAFTRIAGPRLINRSHRFESRLRFAAVATLTGVLIAIPFYPGPWYEILATFPVAIGLTIAVGMLVVWSNPSLLDESWPPLPLGDPFALARVRTLALLGVFASLAAVQAMRENVTYGIVFASFMLILLPATDDVGHHWLARGWYRAQSRGGPLRRQIAALVDAGFLRPTSDAWRFFHLELQSHLANRPGPGSRHRFERRELAESITSVAIVRAQQGRYDLAEEAFRRAIVADLESAVPHFNYGAFLFDHRQDSARAEQHYRRALAINPYYSWALAAYANLLQRMDGNVEQIEELYGRALAVRPNDGPTLRWFALFLHRHGLSAQRTDAIYRRAIAADSDNATLLGAYADFLHAVQDDRDAAQTYYERAIGLGAVEAHVLARYAEFLAADPQQRDRAITLYEQAVASDPDDVGIRVAYAWFRDVTLRDRAGSVELYRRAYELAPDRVDIAAQYAFVLDQLGHEPDRAWELHRQVTADEPTASQLGSYARNCAGRRDWPNAKRLSRQVLETVALGEEPLALECWFYLWASGDSHARRRVHEMLDTGVRSLEWELSAVVDAARSDGHPEIDELAEAARRIARQAPPQRSDLAGSPATTTQSASPPFC